MNATQERRCCAASVTRNWTRTREHFTIPDFGTLKLLISIPVDTFQFFNVQGGNEQWDDELTTASARKQRNFVLVLLQNLFVITS